MDELARKAELGKALYGKTYDKASDAAKLKLGQAAHWLDKALGFERAFLANEAGATEKRMDMALNAALKEEALAFA